MPLLSEKKVYIRSRRRHHPALSWCDSVVFADQFENATEDECWTLKHLGNDMYSIQHQGWYLHASSHGEVWCCGPGEDFKWTIEYTRKGYVSIKSCHGKYLCCDEGFYVTADREHCELWEQWALVDMPHLLVTPTREVYIRSCQQRLFCKYEGLPALSVTPSIIKVNCSGPATDRDVWHVICIDNNKILLKSYRGYLRSDRDGSVKLIENTTITENQGLCWTVENVEGDFKNTIALKSEFGRYLCRDNGDHFMGDGSMKADSTCCRGKSTWWIFLTNSDDVNGNTALKKDAITMKDHNIEFA